MKTLDQLTNQEYRILALVAQGRRNAKIALELSISIRTVENHLYRIFDKLGVSSRTEAALYALQSGLFPRPELSGIAQDDQNNNRYSRSIS